MKFEYRFFGLFIIFFFQTHISISQIGNVLVLDGCTNYLESADSDWLDYDQVLSIECWIQPNCDDSNRILISKQWCEGEFGYYLSVKEGRLFWGYSNTGDCQNSSFVQTIDQLIFVDEFTHVAVMHNQEEIKLFINGISVATEQFDGVFSPIHNSSEPLRIGCYKKINGDITNHFSGLLDEIRIWNIELTEALVQQRMNSSLIGDEQGLVLYYDMEETWSIDFLFIQNHSFLGSFFNAYVAEPNPYTPYITTPEAYSENPINLISTIVTCQEERELSIDIENYKNIVWSNGLTGKTITVNTDGVYVVTVETELCKFFIDQVSVNFLESPHIDLDFEICENDSIIINGQTYYSAGVYYDTIFTISGCDTTFQYQISEISNDSEFITISACQNSTTIFNGEQLEVGSITEFIFENINGCDSIIAVEVIADSIFSEFVHLTTCKGKPLTYKGISLAPNSETEFNLFTVDGCDSIVTVFVEELDTSIDFLMDEMLICNEEAILSSPDENTIWNNETISNQLIISDNGQYFAKYTDSAGCINSDTTNVLFVKSGVFAPNIFSPNSDGINDCFKVFPISENSISTYRLKIFNRWGGLVFETSDIENCWDGRLNNEVLETGIYVWLIEISTLECNQGEILKGDVLILK